MKKNTKTKRTKAERRAEIETITASAKFALFLLAPEHVDEATWMDLLRKSGKLTDTTFMRDVAVMLCRRGRLPENPVFKKLLAEADKGFLKRMAAASAKKRTFVDKVSFYICRHWITPLPQDPTGIEIPPLCYWTDRAITELVSAKFKTELSLADIRKRRQRLKLEKSRLVLVVDVAPHPDNPKLHRIIFK